MPWGCRTVTNQCVATSSASGLRCRLQALPGKDRCVWHGGATPVVTGQYSKYLTKTLRAAVEEASTEVTLVEELRLARGVLARTLQLAEAVADRPTLEMACLGEVQKQVADVRAIVESIDRQNERRSITPEQVELVVGGILRVLVKHVDPAVLDRVAAEMRDMKWPGGVYALPCRTAAG